jgi:hypothetical protein
MKNLLIKISDDDITFNKKLGGCDESVICGLINDNFDQLGIDNGTYTANDLYGHLNTYCSTAYSSRRLEYLKCYCEDLS